MRICGIASIPEREENLKLVLQAIAPQVDRVYVALNGYKDFPEWESEFPDALFIHFDNSLGDAMKFYVADFYHEEAYFLALDDDLVVPKGYADYMCEGVDKYNGVVSLHGKTYLPPVTNFKKWAGNYRCLGTVTEDVKVNLIGSGCCAFNTSRLKLSLSGFETPNKADVYLSKQASIQGVPMVVLKHNANYLQYLKPPDDKTIWNTTRSYEIHVKEMQTFIK